MTKITKLMDPAEATGEYIGVTLIEATPLPNWRTRSIPCGRPTRSSSTSTAYQGTRQPRLPDRRGPIGDVKWVEIDNHDDLAKGREIACLY